MHIQNEISIDNFREINRYAASAGGASVRSNQDDRWLNSVDQSAYRSVYDPSLGRLSTSWREIRPDLIVLYGDANTKMSLTFPVRARCDISGMFVGTNIMFETTKRSSSSPPERPNLFSVALKKGSENLLSIASGNAAFFFGIFGTEQSLTDEFSLVRNLSALMDRINNSTRPPSSAGLQVKNAILNLILQMTHNPYEGKVLEAFITAKALEILSTSYHSMQQTLSVPRTELRKQPIDFICHELERLPEQDVSLQDFAFYLGISERSLSRQFKATTGMTLSAYQRTKRMELAAKLLTMSSLSTIQISQRVGYNAITAFYRAFKDQYGITPDVFRGLSRQLPVTSYQSCLGKPALKQG